MANVKATDLIDFTRASAGHALRKVSYGSELVTNGDFSDTDLSDWTAYDGTIAVVSGELELTYSADTQYVTHSVTTEVGKVYVFSVDARSSNAVDFRLQVENSTFGGGTVEQGYEAAFTSTASARQLVFVAEATTSVIEIFSRLTSGTAFFDNISVKEVTFDQADGTLQLFEHPDNIPRIEYDADGNLLGLLIEEARTNYSQYSDLSAGWNENGAATLTANYAEGIDKTTSMARLQTTGSSQGVYGATSNRLASASSGVTYTVSAVVKHVSGNSQLRFRVEGTAMTVNEGIIVDVATGTFLLNSGSAPDSYNIQDFGNGFYRVSVTVTTSASGSVIPVYYSNQSGDSEFYIGMVNFEQGSFPTSYIKTNGSTASRSADVASIDVDQFGYNHNESTFVAEASELGGLDSNAERHTLFSTETASALRLYVGKNTGGSGSGNEIFVGESASSTYFEVGEITQNTFYKVAVVVKTNDISASLDGGAIASDSSVALAKDETKIGIGSRTYAGTNVFNGHIKFLNYYPKRLSNAKLQELTS